jgi:ribosomal protein L29
MTYTTTELKALSDEALVHAELQLDRELVALNFMKKAGTLRNVMSTRVVRKNIARVRTEQRRREIEQGLAKDSLKAQHRASFVAAAAVKEEGSSLLANVTEQMEETD